MLPLYVLIFIYNRYTLSEVRETVQKWQQSESHIEVLYQFRILIQKLIIFLNETLLEKNVLEK